MRADTHTSDQPVRIDELNSNISVVQRRFGEIRDRQAKLERVKRDLANRRLLERAKGFLMDKFAMTEQQAYRSIHHAARSTCRTLGEVSQEVLRTGERGERRVGRLTAMPIPSARALRGTMRACGRKSRCRSSRER
ncbi:MAG: hypothetical protein C4341_07850 [Armatimonadota bacterium]